MICIDTDAPNFGLPFRAGGASYKPGVLPRRAELVYGSKEAERVGLEPVHEAIPDKLVLPADYKETIAHCIERQVFAQYHQADTVFPPGTIYNQDGIGYCWTFSGTAAVIGVRAILDVEDKDLQLGAVSMGWLVNWQDRGNYLESFIEGARKRGIAPASMCGGWNSVDRNYRNYEQGWEDEALKYRLDKVWDVDTRRGDATTIQHCLSILAYGRPLYIAYNWWGHAVECIGLRWDESQVNNLVWIIRNSHGEAEPIELVGSKAVPDEAYGFVTMKLAA